MIALGSVELRSRASVLSMRSRLRSLAEALRFDSVVATRLAMIASETARDLLRNAESPRIDFYVAGPGQQASALELRFAGWKTAPETQLLERFFDEVRVEATDGVATVAAIAQLRDPSLLLDDVFVAEQRDRLAQRSRGELMREIQAQNDELERHRNQLEDIVEERTAELHTAREAAVQANHAKSQFLSSMSHELRTPLNGVLGYTQILQTDATLTAEQRKSLDAIGSCGRHLLTLINDVLDLSKIEAGQLELRPEPCDLDALVRGVYDIVRPRAESKGLAFEMTKSELPPGIETDPTKLRQVLVNLLGNSVKFTDHGRVAMRVFRAGEILHFEVEDTGIGMTPEEQAEIFDPFKQAEGGHSAGGTGLGLAISKRIVEALGGSLSVESEKGRGSTFHVELPLVEVALEPEAQADDGSLSGTRLLSLVAGQDTTIVVADDNEVNRDILVKLLENAGFRAIEAADGLEAVAAIGDHRPQLVLLDIRMPRMSGIEAARAVRENPELDSVKLVAVSADVLSSLEKELEEAGFDDFIAKPVRAGELFRSLQRHLDLQFVEEGEGSAEADPGQAPAALDLATLSQERLRDWAQRIREAVDLGDVGALDEIALELRGEAGAEALGDELETLAAGFELAAIEELANRLAPAQGPDGETQ